MRLIDYCLTSSEQYFSYIKDENKFNNIKKKTAVKPVYIGHSRETENFRIVPTVWYFRTVPTVWYFRTVPTVWYFRSVPTVWYFRTVPTVWYFRSVPTVWVFFVFHFFCNNWSIVGV